MRKILAVFIALLGLAWISAVPVGAAKPGKTVQVTIDISSQSMSVNVGGLPYGRWKVSTARSGYWTPRGSYRPTRLHKVYYSKKYDNAPMPNSVFFHGGYAIHGTNHIKRLGSPASHGCVRLAPGNAAKLFSLVQRHGFRSVRITIVD